MSKITAEDRIQTLFSLLFKNKETAKDASPLSHPLQQKENPIKMTSKKHSRI